MTFDQQVDRVYEWWKELPKTQQQLFKDYSKDRLIDYHDTLGRYIRNTLGLWELPWEVKIVDGIDMSPNHPDAVSMKIIEMVWEKVNMRD